MSMREANDRRDVQGVSPVVIGLVVTSRSMHQVAVATFSIIESGDGGGPALIP
jgi:hypothetical protein